LLPAPIGPALDSWNVNLGFTTVPFYLALNFVEALFMLAFFVYMTGKLRTKTPPSSSKLEGQDVQKTEGQRMAVPT
jgi:hypothetical protein